MILSTMYVLPRLHGLLPFILVEGAGDRTGRPNSLRKGVQRHKAAFKSHWNGVETQIGGLWL